MAVVKGSKQEKLVVVEYNPFRAILIKVLVVSLIIGIGGTGYWYGKDQGFSGQDQANQKISELNEQIEIYKSDYEEAKNRALVLEKGDDVNESSIEELRLADVAQKAEIAQLKKDINLYKSVMAPEKLEKGVTFQYLQVKSTDDPNKYWYDFMLTQQGANNGRLIGNMTFELIGSLNGEAVRYSLSDLSEKVKDKNIRFAYRYFQQMNGEMVFPEGFIVDSINVIAKTSGSKSKTVTKSYNWSTFGIKNTQASVQTNEQ